MNKIWAALFPVPQYSIPHVHIKSPHFWSVLCNRGRNDGGGGGGVSGKKASYIYAKVTLWGIDQCLLYYNELSYPFYLLLSFMLIQGKSFPRYTVNCRGARRNNVNRATGYIALWLKTWVHIPCIYLGAMAEDHKVHIFIEYHSVCPLVGIGNLPPPFSPASVPLPGTNGGGGGVHTRLRVRGWGSPNSYDGRKSLALCLLCAEDRRPWA